MISITSAETAGGGTIHDPKSKLKVRAYDLLRSNFKASNGEVQFFVTDGTKALAFETKGYKRHRELLILQMISRYCVYLGLLKAQIHSTIPSRLAS